MQKKTRPCRDWGPCKEKDIKRGKKKKITWRGRTDKRHDKATPLVLQDSQASLNDTVLKNRARRNVYCAALRSHNDDSTLQGDIATQVDGTGDGQVVQLDNAGNAGNTLLEVRDLLEVRSKLDHRHTTEAVGVHEELTVLKTVEIRLNEQEVGAGLDGQEATTGHVDTVGVLEVADGSTDSGLELVDGLVGLTLLVSGDGLLVGDDLHLELVFFNNTLDGTEIHPDIVGVEVLELLDGLELVDVLLGDLGDFQKTGLALVVDDGTTLNVGLGLVGQLHNVLRAGVGHVLQDTEVNDGTKIVRIGQEDVLDATLKELVEGARVVEGLKDVTVARRVPVLQGSVEALGSGQERVLDDPGVARLVEGDDVDVVTLVLLDDGLGVLVGVEGVHEDEGNIDIIGAVQVLDLTHGQVEEGHALTNLNDRLGANATHRGTKTTVQLDNSQLVEELNRGLVAQVVVVDDLRGLRRGDAVPVDGVALGLVIQETTEESKEVVHLSLETLLLLGIGDGLGEGIQGVTHLRSGHAGGGILKGLEREGFGQRTLTRRRNERHVATKSRNESR